MDHLNWFPLEKNQIDDRLKLYFEILKIKLINLN
jgi:hypothetical protein